jgi:hypothetical protein
VTRIVNSKRISAPAPDYGATPNFDAEGRLTETVDGPGSPSYSYFDRDGQLTKYSTPSVTRTSPTSKPTDA